MSPLAAGVVESLVSGLVLAAVMAGVRFALVIRDTVRDVRALTEEVADLRRMHRPPGNRHHQHRDRPEPHREK